MLPRDRCERRRASKDDSDVVDMFTIESEDASGTGVADRALKASCVHSLSSKETHRAFVGALSSSLRGDRLPRDRFDLFVSDVSFGELLVDVSAFLFIKRLRRSRKLHNSPIALNRVVVQ